MAGKKAAKVHNKKEKKNKKDKKEKQKDTVKKVKFGDQVTVDGEVITVTAENKCSFCEGSKCCTYTSQEIDAPTSMRDFDQLLWQLAHKNMQAYKDEGDWYLTMKNPCMHLLPNGGCAIYDRRPMICREYSNDFCEYDQKPEDDFELFFDGYDDLDNYCRKKFKNWDKRFEKWAKKK